MKRTCLLPILFLLAALLALGACVGEPGPDPVTDAATTTKEAETTAPVVPPASGISDRYLPDVNTIKMTPGTFTDRITMEKITKVNELSRSLTADPQLYNFIQVMELTRDDLTLYSEMNGGMLEAAWIDALFLEPAAMRDALRGDFTIMAGGYPYTVRDLAYMPEESRAALGISADELAAFLEPIPAAADATGEILEEEVLRFIEANTKK